MTVLVFVSVIVPTAYNNKNNGNLESLRTAGVQIYEKKFVFRQKTRIYIFPGFFLFFFFFFFFFVFCDFTDTTGLE